MKWIQRPVLEAIDEDCHPQSGSFDDPIIVDSDSSSEEDMINEFVDQLPLLSLARRIPSFPSNRTVTCTEKVKL